MKLTLASFLALTIFLTAGFTFFAMYHNPECVAMLVEQASCGGRSGVLSLLFFHVGILQHASWAVVGTAATVLLVLGMLFAWIAIFEGPASPGLVFARTASRFASVPAPSRREIQRWLSLHQKRAPDLSIVRTSFVRRFS